MTKEQDEMYLGLQLYAFVSEDRIKIRGPNFNITLEPWMAQNLFNFLSRVNKKGILFSDKQENKVLK